MKTAVHGKNLVIDKWCGEPFSDELKFKTPVWKGGKWTWRGCYAIPSTALAALNLECATTTPPMAPERREEVFQHFQASLVNQDPDRRKFEIVPAPDFHDLKTINPLGKITAETFHENTSWDFQRRYFRQVIPASEDDKAPEAAAGPTGVKRKLVIVPNSLSVPYKKKEAVTDYALGKSPRNLAAWMDFLQKIEGETHHKKSSGSIAVTINPDTKTMVLWDPIQWGGKKSNPRATQAAGGKPVYGNAIVISKKELKTLQPEGEKKAKKQKMEVEAAAGSDASKEENRRRSMYAMKRLPQAAPPPPTEDSDSDLDSSSDEDDFQDALTAALH